MSGFPRVRMRRNRSKPFARDLVAESSLSVNDLIWPLFVQEENGTSVIESMPGVVRYGPDQVVDGAGRDPMDIGLLDDREQGSLGPSAGLEQRGEVAAVADAWDGQVDRAHTRAPTPPR